MDQSKSILHSKTFWINLIIVLPEVLELIMDSNFLPITHAQYIVIIGLVNIFLRMMTNGSVAMKMPSKINKDENTDIKP